MATTDGDDANETIDADPALLAQLRDQAAKRQQAANAAPEAPEAPTDQTIDADPALLAQLRDQAAERQQAEVNSPDESNLLDDPTIDDDSLGGVAQAGVGSIEEDAATRTVARVGRQELQDPTIRREVPSSSAASQFVRDARNASEEQKSPEAEPGSEKKSRSGLVVLAAIVVGAQILAVGVFFSLRALQGDEEPVDEVAAELADEELEEVAPTPIPAGATAVPIPPTPTPVPPTPEWQPINEGPRTNPFSYSVEAIVNAPVYLDGPGGNELDPQQLGITQVLTNPRPSGEPLVFQVVEGIPGDDWARIQLTGTSEDVWVDASEFAWRSSNTSIQVDISVNLIRIFEGNTMLHVASVASGQLSTPTEPIVTYAIEDPVIDPASRTVVDLEADEGRLRIELVDGSITDDGYITDGTVRVTRETAAAIDEHITAGSTIEFIGTPPRPTPTPVPTPTRVPPEAATGPSAPSRCPQQGTPPNCYRVVDRLMVKGECESFQVEIDNACMLFGGSIRSDPGLTPCKESAPTQIGRFCYRRVGPVPEVPGGCPPGAIEVDGECRIPQG